MPVGARHANISRWGVVPEANATGEACNRAGGIDGGGEYRLSRRLCRQAAEGLGKSVSQSTNTVDHYFDGGARPQSLHSE
jgi:hypothetical protein